MAKSVGWNFSVEEIKENLKKKMERNKALIDNLQAISFPTKKDGKPFKQMGKNFNGCVYIDCTSPYIKISFKYDNINYTSHSINCYTDKDNGQEVCEYYYNGKPQYYYLSLEEIKEKINEEIIKYKKQFLAQFELLQNLEDREEIKMILEYQKFCNEMHKFISPSKENMDLQKVELAYLIFDFI